MRALFFSILIVFTIGVYGQSAKQAKQYKIKTKTVVKTIEENGKQISFTETVETFNKNGKTLSKTEYSKSGKVKNEKKYKYDNFGNVIEESEKDTKDGTHFIITYTYNADGNKITETKKDAAGNLIEKSTFGYDVRGLRTEKKEFDQLNKLKSVRKTTYENY